jgi:hypothetical protein
MLHSEPQSAAKLPEEPATRPLTEPPTLYKYKPTAGGQKQKGKALKPKGKRSQRVRRLRRLPKVEKNVL